VHLFPWPDRGGVFSPKCRSYGIVDRLATEPKVGQKVSVATLLPIAGLTGRMSQQLADQVERKIIQECAVIKYRPSPDS
jgi:hypothetical protein